MRLACFAGAFFFLTILGCVSGGSSIPWATSGFDAALKEAASKDKLLMVDFYTDWCGWCKELDKTTFTNEQVKQKASQMVAIKVNAEKGEGPELARRYGVQGFPAILFLNKQGMPVHRVDGFLPPEQFLQQMERALATPR